MGAFPFTEDHAVAPRGHALRLTVETSEAAFELHSSRLVPSRRRQQEAFRLNDLAGYRVCRSEQAKLTACRKVRRMYRREVVKSSKKGPENREILPVSPLAGARQRTGLTAGLPAACPPASRIAAIARIWVRA